jgi:integrase/recombinase XerD
MNKITYKIILRTDRIKSDGKCLTCLQAFVNGKRKVISLNYYLYPECFDDKAQQAIYSAKHKDFTKELVADANLIFQKHFAKANEILVMARITNATIKHTEFENQFINEYSRADFLGFCLSQHRAQGKALSKGSQFIEKNTFRKLKKFAGETIEFSQITNKFITDFERFLKNKENLSINTITNHLKKIRKYISMAINQGIPMPIKSTDVILKNTKTYRERLTQQEVKALIDLYRSGELKDNLQRCLHFFLISCFTGVRISDAHQVTPDKIESGILVFTPVKTQNINKTLRIPLSKLAIELIEKNKEHNYEPFANAVANRYLKTIADFAQINKRITFHVSRHTFAYSFLTAGGKLERLQQIMGHTDIKTTMIYAHTDEQGNIEDIEKLDALFN